MRTCFAYIVFSLVVLVWSGNAFGARFSNSIDLAEPDNAELVKILGDNADDLTGSVLAAGDFNNDNRRDIVIGAYTAQSGRGVTYIIFGGTTFFDGSTIDLDAYPANVVRIVGKATLDWSGYSIAVGNVNGDLYKDLIIGAVKADPSSRINAGEVYVILGTSNFASRGTIDLSGSPTGVVRIYGALGDDGLGSTVAAGDADGDGYDDLIIGASKADPANRLNAGISYLIFGSSIFPNTPIIDLNTATSNVVRIYGEHAGDTFGYSAASGDLNGDNRDEVIISSYDALEGRGATYIIPGYAEIDTLTTIDLLSPPAEIAAPSGIVYIYGSSPGDRSGSALAIGNMNNDAYDDLVLGAFGKDNYNGTDTGETNVLFGHVNFKSTGVMYLGSLIGNMMRVYGRSGGNQSGISVSLGDINGDGFGDLVVGSPGDEIPGKLDSGVSYIVWGSADAATRGLVDMGLEPERVSRIYGAAAGDNHGSACAVGDLNGDGIGDLITSAYHADPGDRSNAGSVYAFKGLNAVKCIKFSPASGAYVNRNTQLELFFNSDLDSLYVDLFVGGMGAVQDSVILDLNHAVVIPDTLFNASTFIDVTVNGLDLDGVPITPKTWTFYTKSDEVPPRIVKQLPLPNETNVSTTQNIVITFSPDIKPDSTQVTINGSGDRLISMANAWSDSVLTLVNNYSFQLNETIKVHVRAGDQYGDRADSTWTFTTRPETQRPYFKVKYDGNPMLLPKASTFRIYFPIDVDKSSVETLVEGSQSGIIPGTWAWADTVYTYTHTTDFTPGETLNLIVSVADIHKNAIDDSLFIFAVKPDEVPPSIIETIPAANETNVSTQIKPSIQFSSDVNRDSTVVSITTAKQGAKAYAKSWGDYTVTFYPTTDFLVGDTVTMSVKAGDSYANRMESTWSFTVRPEMDQPVYTVRVPNTRTQMSVNDPISLLFPRDIDKPTVTTSFIDMLGGIVPGTWAWSDTVYTFTPTEPYKRGYTLTLTVSASDIHKNSISQATVFNVKPDDDPPALKYHSPETNQVNIPLSSTIRLDFSSDVVRDSTWVVLNSANRGILAHTDTWNDSTLTVTPSVSYASNETITATVGTGDLYGNRATYEWSFSTGAKVVLPYYKIKVPKTTTLMGKYDTIRLLVTDKVDKNAVSLILTGSSSGVLSNSWAHDDTSFVFTPENGYTYAETLTLKVNAKDIYGNSIPEETFIFTVKGDETPPSIIALFPAASEPNAHPEDVITISFTPDVVPDSVKVNVIGSIQGTLNMSHSWQGSQLRLTRSGTYRLSEQVSVSLTAVDVFSNRMSTSWTFTIRPETDKPSVSLEKPVNPNLVAFTDPITLAFSNDIDKNRVTTILVDGDGAGVAGNWAWDGVKRTFTPNGYPAGKQLTLTVNGYDTHNNQLDERIFTLKVKDDEIPPVFLSVSPEDKAVYVYPETPVVVRLSDDAEHDSTKVLINGSIGKSISYNTSWNGNVLTINPINQFQLGETISVYVYTADRFANHSSIEWTFDIIPDDEPPMFQLVPSGDRNNLAINALITLTFPPDIDKASVATSLAGSESGPLQGKWAWNITNYTFTPTVNYRYGETLTLTVSASDTYGNEIPETTETMHVGSHTPWMTINKVTLSDSLAHIYAVEYTVSDPDNSFTKTRDWRYLVGNGLWNVVPENFITNNTSRQPGTYTINFRLPDAFFGVYSDSVYFRMDVFDGTFSSGYQVSPPFHVDVNEPPAVVVKSVGNVPQYRHLTVSYSIYDRESNPVSLAFEYSPDNGATWKKGTPDNDVSKIYPAAYNGTLTWAYTDSLKQGIDYTGVRVRLTPSDYKTGNTSTSDPVRVDLNTPPTLVLDDIFTPQNGVVTLTYHIQDAESDTVSLKCYYSLDGGQWIETPHVTGTQDILEYNGTFIWNSKKDIPSIESFGIRFKAVPMDHDTGTGDETEAFQLINNGPPVVVAALPDTVGNVVRFAYTITDAENDPVNIAFEWSHDGETWTPATISGVIQNLGQQSYAGSLTWHAATDLGSGVFPGLAFRLYGTDAANPAWSSSLNYDVHTITVDNEGPKLAAAWGTALSDTVYFSYNETVADSVAKNILNYSLSHDLTPGSIVKDPVRPLFFLKLASGQKLPYEVLTLTAHNMGDRFDNISSETSVEFFPNDDNVNPSVSLGTLGSEIGGDVTISYTVTDPEYDTVSLAISYSLDSGTTWRNASVSGAITDLSPSAFSGSFIWRTSVDLPGLDIPGVILRAVATDSQAGDPYKTSPFRIDNNQPPAITLSVADPSAIHSGNVQVSFSLTDAESDTLGLRIQYSLDNGTTYLPATTTGTVTGITSSGYSGAFIWTTSVDMPTSFGQPILKVTPMDHDEGASDSAQLWIDNYGACRVTVSAGGSEQSGPVTISYAIQDVNSRTVSLRAEYSIDSGATWHQASLSGTVSNLGPANYNGSFVWNAPSQLPGFEGAAQLKVIPNNGIDGIFNVTPVTVDYNVPPTVAVLPITAEVSDNVSVQFTIDDPERDVISASMEYSIDAGKNWYETEYGGQTTGFAGDGTVQTLIWKSVSDLPGKEYTDVRIRVTVSDTDKGSTGEITGVHLDNNRPPAVTLSIENPDVVREEYVDIAYTLTDEENNMLSMAWYYSVDGGKTYHDATVTGKTSAIFSSGYSSTIRWEATEDLSYFGTVIVKAIPSDNDPGKPDSLSVKINTFGVCTVAVTAPPEEQESDVPISYIITDAKGQNVSLAVKYSFNNGLSWITAKTSGNLTGIDSGHYTGSFTWLASQDMPGKDFDCLLIVTPDNGSPGLADTVAVSVDYNKPPSIASILTETSKEYTGMMSLSFTVADNENDATGIALEYSLDGGATFLPAKTTGPTKFTPGRTGQFAWATFDALGFIYKASVYLRFTPSDNDAGEPVVAGPYTVTNHIGDFTLDGAIDAADLIKFTTVWKNSDTTKETGPVIGKPPALTVMPDGKIDFEDLTAFVWMWNWYSGKAALKEVPVAKAAETESDAASTGTALIVTAEKNGILSFSSGRTPDFIDAVVMYDDGSPIDASPMEGEYWTESQGVVLTRTYNGKAFELAAARFDDTPFTGGTAGDLGGIRVTRPSGDLVVSWSVRFAGEETIYEGTTVVSRDDVFTEPSAFALRQNTPNPFNPSTTIGFSIPDDSHVTLTVRSITGQLVETLKDEFLYAGDYSVTWDASALANGVYFYTIRAGDYTKTRKMTLVK